MKTTSTITRALFCTAAILSLNISVVSAQCVAPAMTYANPVLVSGVAGAINAKYKFPSVTPGVDAYITIKDKVGGATLTTIDDNTLGYSAAWQPVVKTPTTQTAGESYISFNIQFRNSSDNSNHVYNCFVLSFIDVDGDAQHVREFVAAKNFDSYTISSLTSLTLSQQNGFTKAMSTITQYSGIDTASYSTDIKFNYKNTDQVEELRIGNKTDNSFTVQDRYTCGYFRAINIPFAATLPVKYASFDAVVANKAVNLKWVTEMELNNDHFEVERSFNGNDFKSIGIVLDGFATGGGTGKSYQFKDNSAELQGQKVAYYRLKQIDMDGKATYSNVIAVRLQASAEVNMEVAPNPFVQDLYVRFNATESGVAEVKIINVAGQSMLSKQVSISKGYNNLHVEGLNRLAPGVYVAQLFMNGKVIDNQKIVKN